MRRVSFTTSRSGKGYLHGNLFKSLILRPKIKHEQFSQKRRLSFTTSRSGVKYKDVIVGTGKQPLMGERVFVHYTGRLENGLEFDSSYKRGVQTQINLSEGAMMRWDEAISTMREGGKRTVYVPPELSHGYRSLLNIRHDSTLVFECELVGIAAANVGLFRCMWGDFDSVPHLLSLFLGLLMLLPLTLPVFPSKVEERHSIPRRSMFTRFFPSQ